MNNLIQHTTPDEFYDIRILKDGTWLYAGTPIKRHNMVKLFSRVMSRDEKGDYWLITPYERGRIYVEDAPFLAVSVESRPTPARESADPAELNNLYFRTNVDDEVMLGAEHPLRISDEGIPYIFIRKGLEARLTRAVYYELVNMVQPSPEQPDVYGVTSGGVFFRLGNMRE